MKKIIKHILIVLIPFALFACSKPLPTELTDENSQEQSGMEINSISPDNELIYSNGYDSTGTDLSIPGVSSIVSVSAIKTTYKTRTDRKELAEAMFFDRTLPVMHPNGGGKLLGFRTKNPGAVSFDNIPARLVPYKAFYRDKGAIRDTLLGLYYLLYKYNNSGDSFTFTHDSKINFRLKLLMNRFEEIEIQTPEEIFAEIDVNGSLQSKNLSFMLKWNPSNKGKIEIVMCGLKTGDHTVVPLTRILVSDKGAAKIPVSLLKEFPLEQFSRIVFTLIRKKVTEYQSQSALKDNLIVAQTLHSIQLDIPK